MLTLAFGDILVLRPEKELNLGPSQLRNIVSQHPTPISLGARVAKLANAVDYPGTATYLVPFTYGSSHSLICAQALSFTALWIGTIVCMSAEWGS